jgi:hypothetical protein
MLTKQGGVTYGKKVPKDDQLCHFEDNFKFGVDGQPYKWKHPPPDRADIITDSANIRYELVDDVEITVSVVEI